MSHALEDLAEGMTVEEFARRTGRSVAEVVAFCLRPATPSRRRAARSYVPPFDHFAALRPVVLDDDDGRLEFASRILMALEHLRLPMSEEEIARFAGGTALQVEQVLEELEAEGAVRRRGPRGQPLWTSKRR